MFKFINKKVIKSEINRCINEDIKEVFLRKINFESAISYAVDHGTRSVDIFTKVPNRYVLEIEVIFNCKKYRVIFKRLENNGTHITILSPGEITEEAKEILENIRKRRLAEQ